MRICEKARAAHLFLEFLVLNSAGPKCETRTAKFIDLRHRTCQNKQLAFQLPRAKGRQQRALHGGCKPGLLAFFVRSIVGVTATAMIYMKMSLTRERVQQKQQRRVSRRSALSRGVSTRLYVLDAHYGADPSTHLEVFSLFTPACPRRMELLLLSMHKTAHK